MPSARPLKIVSDELVELAVVRSLALEVCLGCPFTDATLVSYLMLTKTRDLKMPKRSHWGIVQIPISMSVSEALGSQLDALESLESPRGSED